MAHPRAVAGAAAVLALASCLAIPRIAPRLDARSLIPAGHDSMRESDRAAERFALRDVVVLAVESPRTGIYDPAALALLARLSAELGEVPGILPRSVVSLATVPRLYVEGDVLDLSPRLAPGAVPAPATARRLASETRALGLDDGILVAADGRAAAIYAEVEPAADRSALAERVRSLAARHAGAGFPIHWSGTAMAQAVLGEVAALDLARLVPLVLLIVVAVLVLAFRHPVPAIVSLSEVGASLLCTLGVMGLARQPVFVTTLVLPVILIVIGITDDIYALNRTFAAARETPGRPPRPISEVVVESFSQVGGAILLSAATTIAGLLSLAFTSLAPQRVFGFYGALSVVFSTLATFTLVPALLVLFDPKVAPAPAPFARAAERAVSGLLAALDRLGPRRVLAGVLVVCAASAALVAARLRIEDNWVGNLPRSSATVRGDRAINRLLAGTNTLDLMLDSGRPQGFLEPRAFAALGRVEDRLAASPLVGAIQGPFSDVSRVEAALGGRSYGAERRLLRQGEGLPRPAIEQARMLLASAGRSPGSERLDGDDRRARITLFLRRANYSRTAAVLRQAAAAVREELGPAVAMVPFGDGWVGYLSIRFLVVGQVISIGFAFVSDTALLVLLFRSLKTALLTIAPVVASVLFVFALLAGSGTPLGTANSMFAAIALGIGVDYSIHLVSAYRERLAAGERRAEAMSAAARTTGPAILTSGLAIVAGFSVLIASEVPPNRQLGLLICLSLAVCAAMTLVLVPSLVRWRKEEP